MSWRSGPRRHHIPISARVKFVGVERRHRLRRKTLGCPSIRLPEKGRRWGRDPIEARPRVRKAGSMSKRREAAFVEPAFDGEVEVGERVTVLDLTTGAMNDFRIGDGGIAPDSP